MSDEKMEFVSDMFAPGMLISSDMAASMAQKAYDKWRDLKVCKHLRVKHVGLLIFECEHCEKKITPKGWQEV